MFETWVELRDPTLSAENNSISHENSIVLKLIMDIILELYSMIEHHEEAKQQFLKKYQDRFEKQLLINFPYNQNANNKRELSGGEKCVYQNLSISILFLAFSTKNQQRFHKYRERVFNFIEDCIITWKTKDQEFNNSMRRFIRFLFNESRQIFAIESKKVFNELVKKCSVDQSSYDPKLALVCEIIEKSDFSCDHLVSQMVGVLAEKDVIPVHLIKTISAVAKRGNKALIESVEKLAIEIAKNFKKMKISGVSENNVFSYKIEISNLFYWIKNEEVLKNLSQHLQPENDLISNRIKEIILSK